MKRIIYSCFLFTLIFLSNNIFAQAFNGTVTPQSACFNAAGNFGQAGVIVASAGAVSYSWAITPPTGASVTQTVIVPIAPSTGPSSLTSITYSGCGQYSLTALAFNNPMMPPTQSFLLFVNIECPRTASFTSDFGAGVSPTICSGNSTTLSASGGSSFTLTPGNVFSGNIFTVSPSATTCYTINGTTAIGCSLTPVASCVTVQILNTSASPATQTICPGLTVTLTANSTAGGILSGPIAHQWFSSPPSATLGTSITQTDTPLASTIYTVISSINGCTATATSTAVIGPTLSILVSASSASACPGEQFTLTAITSATDIAWGRILPPTPVFAATGETAVTTGPGIYTVQGSNGSCFGASSVTIFPTIITLTVVPSATAVCPGESFTLVAFGGNATVFDWANVTTSSPICFVCSGTLVPVPQSSPTIYGVRGTNSFGCEDTALVQIGITPNVNPTLTASSASVCASSQVTLIASGGTLYTFSSNTSGPISGPATNSVIISNPTSSTIYSVLVTNANGFCGAVATVTVGMTVGGNLPLLTSASAGTICQGFTASLSVSGAINYTWSPIISVSPVNSATAIASPTITTTYTVTGNNGAIGGCTGTASIKINVDPKPVVNIIALPTSVCAGFTSTLTASGANAYQWTGSTFPIPINQPSISVSPGSYTVVGFTSGGNCPSDPKFVAVGQAPPLNITAIVSPPSGTTCIIQNYPYKYSKSLNLTASGAQTYVWLPNNPIFMTIPVGAQTIVRPPASTCYTVTGTTPACTGSAVICVNVIPQFTMNVVPPLPAICIKDSVRLAIVNINGLAVAPYTYNWSDPLNNSFISLTSQNSLSVIAFPQSTSTYTTEVTDSRGCVSIPRLVTVTVLPRPISNIAIPIINGVPTNSVCFVGDRPGAPDNRLDLVASNQNGVLPLGITSTYTWISPYAPSSIITSSNTPLVTTIAPKRLPTIQVFTLMSGYNGIAGCKRIDTVSIRVVDCRPVANYVITFTTDVVKNDILCSRDCITYQATTDTAAGGPQKYEWDFVGGSPSKSFEKSPVVCYDLPGEWDVILKVTNPYPILDGVNGGSVAYKSQYRYIKVVDYPNVTIIAPGQLRSDTTVKFGQSIVLTATNATSYTWSPNINISALSGTIVTVNPTKTQLYIVYGRNGNRCRSSDSINVVVIDDCGDMYIPNAFSPNGDGVNDELTVNGVCLQTLTFMIFNRWGEKVFETTDVKVGWDGTYQGDKVNTGVFFYRLEGKSYDGKGYSSKGNITLIR